MNFRQFLQSWAFAAISLLLVACAAVLNRHFPQGYNTLIQEDGPLEWATFWAFTGAGLISLVVWLRGRKLSSWRSLYLLGFAAGCLAIAGEEISWGQRLFAYRPPEIFLTGNYQQEFNLHNFASTHARQAVMLLLLVGFGMVLPLSTLSKLIRNWIADKGINLPARTLIPGFAIATALYLVYPWRSTGEWVELLLGLGFLTAALQDAALSLRLRLHPLWWLCAPLLAGAISPRLVPVQDGPHLLALAQQQTDALARDFQQKRLRSRCGVHKRIYTFIEEYGSTRLDQGAYANLAEIQSHYLDPWNLPYWVRHTCSKDRATSSLFIYSFGPNRRRDSSKWDLAGDDIGSYSVRRRKHNDSR